MFFFYFWKSIYHRKCDTSHNIHVYEYIYIYIYILQGSYLESFKICIVMRAILVWVDDDDDVGTG